MQKTKQLTLTLLFLIVPMITFAQIGAKKYVTKSKDTTVVVMDQSGIKSEASAFLRDRGISEPDNSRYDALSEAANQTSKLAENVIDLGRELNTAENTMDFERSKRNIERNRIEREIERLERKKMLFMDTSADEKAFLEQKFGNKPSYFLNGIPADEKIISYISDRDILSRSLKVANTVTGNPNGEIWYVVSNKTLQKFGITPEENIVEEAPQKEFQVRGEYFEQHETQESVEPAYHNDNVRPTKTASSNISPEQKRHLTKQEEEVEALKKQINAVRVQQGLAPFSDAEFSSAPINSQEPKKSNENFIFNPNFGKTPANEKSTSAEKEKDVQELRKQINTLRIERGLEPLPDTPLQIKEETREADTTNPLHSIRRSQQKQDDQSAKSTNNQQTPIKSTQESKAKDKDKIVTFNDSPLEQAKKQEEETPKRSVRKIKERERER